MPVPALSPLAQRIYDGLAPLARQDAQNGYALAYYVAGLCRMFDQVEGYARDDAAGDPGWSELLDLDRCPTEALPFLAQFVGVTLTTGLTDAQWRDQIRAVNNWQRGSLAAFTAAAQQYLTGTKTVIIRERDPGASPLQPAYGITVITRTSETPDSAAVLAALLGQKPAGIILNYQVLAGADYQQILAEYATYQTIFTTFLTYEGVLDDTPGT